jgi:hypothetical protein
VAQQVYLAAGEEAKMKGLGLRRPPDLYRPYRITGKTFVPADPDCYVATFPIRRT